jgi:TRAP-type C4-dicarboxylate transport system substrate-binding protein
MDSMMSRFGLRAIALTAIITLAVAGCSGTRASADKAGGAGEPVVLRMANTYGDLGDLPAIAYFVDRVEELSGGEVRIELVDDWGDSATDAERQVVRGVSTGDVDLGWAGTRVFDTLGVTTFQALTAPMLIDSYALEDAVIESGITEQMMEGLDEVDVVGLGVLADGLRKPVGVSGPIVVPADWRGITFGTVNSIGHADAIRTLGAMPTQVFGSGREEALDKGTIQGFEFNLDNYARESSLKRLAPYMTANVILWPLMDVLLANPARLADLTDEQRGWLEEAARDAAARSADLVDKDADVLADACRSGARFAEASTVELAALEEGFAPVYANLQQDPETKAFIEQIQAIKRATVPEPSLSIPSDCTGNAPEQVTRGAGTAPAYLNGTYRYEITLDEARKADMVDPEDTYPNINTIALKDGALEGGCFGADGGTYSVEDDRITIYSVEYDVTSTVTFERDDQGSLHLTPVPPIDPGDAFQCYSQVWTKIG